MGGERQKNSETVLRISDKDELESILQHYNIDSSRWEFKGLSELLEEIQAGETELVDSNGTLIRKVRVARVTVFYQDNGQLYRLVETKQVKSDGEVRERNSAYIGEKIKASESPEQGAVRGLLEELQIAISESELSNPQEFPEQKDSRSYPGLPSRYDFYLFDVHLSANQYNPNGYSENDGQKTTHFKWQLVNVDLELPQ